MFQVTSASITMGQILQLIVQSTIVRLNCIKKHGVGSPVIPAKMFLAFIITKVCSVVH